jgi:hypothetical protein
MKEKPLTNFGHGHVYPRADGGKMRCGGPGICLACAKEAEQKRREEERAAPNPVALDDDDDFADVELGPACSLDNPECESCQ